MAKSIYELFQNTVAARKDRVAAQYKSGGAWRDVTWGEMDKTSRLVAAALVKHGVQPKEMVSLISNTRLEWITADLGIQGAGATTVPIYQSSTPDDTQFILTDAGSVAVIVEDNTQLKKMRGIKAAIPKVKKVIAMSGDVDDSGWEITWEAFLKEGEAYLASNEADVKARSAGLTPSDLLTLIYTSGTTGRPKGAMLTHDNMLYQAEAIHKINLISPEDTQYLFLPMAHVFAKVLETIWFQEGHVMAFWSGDMKKIVDELGEVRPTMMCSVPRIFEKVHAKVVSDTQMAPGLAGKIARWGIAQGEKAGKLEQAGAKPGGIAWALAEKLVFSKIQAKLSARFGGRLRFFVSGGAPLGKDVAYFFKYAGVTICEGFGLTETSAASSVNRPADTRIGTVGKALPGTEFKVASDGELLIRGRGVMKGYWGREDATKEAIDPENWFHTGDIGVIDGEGYIKITDRKKDIIVTAGGKNVAPQNLENLIKSKSSLISQVVVHGDKRKFLSAIITLDEENVKNFAKQRNMTGDYAALTQKPEVEAALAAAFKDINTTLASYESIKKWKILDHDFTIGDKPEEKDKPGASLLTASLKVKRKAVNERYKDVLDGFYADGAGGD
ncbi:MAG: long-chain fatty acid--CoA ligase [Deltaproteobacteria bacterium]|nr:long-chain fatty acid--CoA ligase [Deltaproteobacteria bacterium]